MECSSIPEASVDLIVIEHLVDLVGTKDGGQNDEQT